MLIKLRHHIFKNITRAAVGNTQHVVVQLV